MRELFECIYEYPMISICLGAWISIIVVLIFNKD